ncbi:MAG: trypsin-like peptidase domain-containing protein [Subdoligranulum variabile]|nr:trypsin-like peptidase domain-containing protein [Subdoligranulum variabile]
MSNEYDYSGLYNNGQGGNTPDPNQGQNQNQAQNEASQASANQPGQPEQGSYPNVGSSGINTANTARTDYSTSSPNTYNQPGNTYGQNPSQNPSQNNGYASSFSGGNGSNGGYNGYSYASAPQQPPKHEKKKNKVLLRVLAGVGVVALGFGGGFGGAIAASRAGLTGNQVVVQEIQRDTSTDATSTGSTDGSAMTMQQIASVASPSVVAITTEQMSSSQTWFGGYYVQSGAGSGIIISQDGYILTCAHVVSGATSVKVQLNGSDETYDATIVGEDSTSDIAVLKIEATGLTPAVIGDSDKLAVGETTVAVGNPLGTLSNTVTQGIVSALNRQVTVEDNDMTLIQTDTSISPGNSGGGLFNANGELIGVVNAKSSYSEAEGIGFAIPINTAMDIAQQLIENGAVARPVLGVSILDISDASAAQQYGVSAMGVYVADVTKGGGAEAAGVQRGDRIIAVDDTAVSSTSTVKSYLADKEVGDTVSLQVERDGKVLTLNVTLGSSAQYKEGHL